MMDVSVVIVCYNEERNLPDILDSLVAQTYRHDHFEVLIVDNNSSDGTHRIAQEYAGCYDNFRVVKNPVQGIAPSRNVGLREARHPYVAFTDADCVVPPDWLERLAEGYERYKPTMPTLVAVGGGNVAHDLDDPFLRSVAITLNSFWGSHGSTQGMLFEEDVEVPHIPCLNILYDRQAVLDAGGFDERFGNICEDPELNHRLARSGRRMMFLHRATVRHKLRPDMTRWFKNVFTYGKGRSWLIRKHPDHFRVKFLAPPLMILGFLLSPLGVLHWGFLVFPIAYVAGVVFLTSMLALRGDYLRGWFTILVILALNPIFYGLGQFHGAVRWPRAETNEPGS